MTSLLLKAPGTESALLKGHSVLVIPSAVTYAPIDFERSWCERVSWDYSKLSPLTFESWQEILGHWISLLVSCEDRPNPFQHRSTVECERQKQEIKTSSSSCSSGQMSS